MFKNLFKKAQGFVEDEQPEKGGRILCKGKF